MIEIGGYIASVLVALLGLLAAYLKTRKTASTLENKKQAEDLKEAKETIDKMSNRPRTPDDVHKLFARAKVAAREGDKTE